MQRIRSGLFLPRRLPVIQTSTLEILVGEFYIIKKFIIGGDPGELIGRTETKHKTIFSFSAESRNFFHDIVREPVINEFVMLIFDQPLLESQQSPVSFKTEHIDQRIEVKASITIRSFSDFQS